MRRKDFLEEWRHIRSSFDRRSILSSRNCPKVPWIAVARLGRCAIALKFADDDVLFSETVCWKIRVSDNKVTCDL